jgi:hypothetical protein
MHVKKRMMEQSRKRPRSALAKPDARRRYVEIAELVVLEQIRHDAQLLDGGGSIAVGPFARLDASSVAAKDDKTRGAITNLFGSQAAFQSATMALALSASGEIQEVTFPKPEDFSSAENWLDAFLVEQSARGPHHGAEPALGYASLWTLWLSAVPYGLWSEKISGPSLDEHVQWVERVQHALRMTLDHFGMDLRVGTTINDLACAIASMIEGVWLNQCLTTSHPCDPKEEISTVLRRSGRLLWRGATEPA